MFAKSDLGSEILPHRSQKVNHGSVPGHVLEGGKGDKSGVRSDIEQGNAFHA